jgi:hypothetical protein
MLPQLGLCSWEDRHQDTYALCLWDKFSKEVGWLRALTVNLGRCIETQ